jgi:hypothetical protein
LASALQRELALPVAAYACSRFGGILRPLKVPAGAGFACAWGVLAVRRELLWMPGVGPERHLRRFDASSNVPVSMVLLLYASSLHEIE